MTPLPEARNPDRGPGGHLPQRGSSRSVRHGRSIRDWAASARRWMSLQSQFSPYLRPYRRRLALAILLSVAYAGLRLLEPWPLQILFDNALLDNPTHFLGLDPLALAGGDRTLLLAACAGALVVVAILSGTVYYLQNILIAETGQSIVFDLRKDLFHQMQRLSLPFHQRAGSGDLLMRLTGDMILLREMILATLVTLTSQSILIVSILGLMTAVSLRLTLVSILVAPLLYILFRFFRARMTAAARKQRRREGRIGGAIEEVLLSIPMIQAYTAEDREDDRFRKLCKKSLRSGLRAARLEAGMQRWVEIALAAATALVLWFGVREVFGERITPGILLVFLAYLRAVYRPVRGIAKVAERTARASAAAERVLEVLHARREIKDSRDALEVSRLAGAIEFHDVGFVYENGTRALECVSFKIRPGEEIALVGPTGAGKSTLFSLLLRFHNATEGSVRLDRRKIKVYALSNLRSQITYLSQEPFVLSATIRENLLYGKPDATDEELRAALRVAALDHFVDTLPEGIDTPILARGQTLSGGQKQRVSIARAALKNAPILLLDEPTAGLDARVESEVLESLERLRRGRTSITIAHHFHTLMSVDRVLVLDQGRLVEDGPPEELLSRPSLFRLLAGIQGIDPGLSSDARSRDARPSS